MSGAGVTPMYTRFRWFTATAAIIANITLGSYLVAFAPIIGVVAAELGVTIGQATILLITTFTLTGAVGAVASGPLIDRFGVRACIIGGGVVAAVASLLLPFADDVSWIVALRALQGAGMGPASACIPALAARWFPPQERGLIIGGQGFGIGLGVALGFLIIPASLQTYGGDWRPGMVWLGVMSVVSLILCIATLRGREPDAPDSPTIPDGASAGDFKSVLCQRTFYVAAVSLLAYSWVMNAFRSLAPAYLAVDRPLGLGFGSLAAGRLMMSVQIGMIIGSVSAGVLAKSAFKGNVRPMIMLGFLCAAVFVSSVELPVIHRSLGSLAACLFLAGFFEVFVVTGVATFVALNYPHGIVGRVFGLMLGIAAFGGTAGVGVGGVVLHETNSFQAPMFLISLVGLVGMAVAAFLKPPAVRKALAKHV